MKQPSRSCLHRNIDGPRAEETTGVSRGPNPEADEVLPWAPSAF